MSVTVQLRIISRYVCGGINTDRIGVHVYRRRMIMRLIDADAFGNRMYHEVFEKDSDDQRWDSGCWMRYKLFEKVLKEQPTVEQPERKHGHWLRTGRTNVYGGFEVECSVCNDSVMITNIEYEHYCRNCGARMDEEEVSE